MRRILPMLMVLLLVLRGLLGDAMAMGAAPVPTAPVRAPAMAMAAHEAHHHAPALAAAWDEARATPAMHHGHDQDHARQAASCAQGDAAACGGHEHGGSCTLCGICHSALFTSDLLPQGDARLSSALRPQGSTRFASAARLQAIKPPIS